MTPIVRRFWNGRRPAVPPRMIGATSTISTTPCARAPCGCRPGGAAELRDGLRHLVVATRREIPRAFESEEYIAVSRP